MKIYSFIYSFSLVIFYMYNFCKFLLNLQKLYLHQLSNLFRISMLLALAIELVQSGTLGIRNRNYLVPFLYNLLFLWNNTWKTIEILLLLKFSGFPDWKRGNECIQRGTQKCERLNGGDYLEFLVILTVILLIILLLTSNKK